MDDYNNNNLLTELEDKTLYLPLLTNSVYPHMYSDEPQNFLVPKLNITIQQPNKKHIRLSETHKLTELINEHNPHLNIRTNQNKSNISSPMAQKIYL